MNMKKYKLDNDVIYSCKYQVIWCVKYRRKVLKDDIEVRLHQLIKEACGEIGVEILNLIIMPDYVNLLLEIAPGYGVHRAIKHIKRSTSPVLRNEFPELSSRLPTLWTNSYFVCSVGSASSADIQQYLNEQITSNRQETPKRKRIIK